jgi:hypothetical protein
MLPVYQLITRLPIAQEMKGDIKLQSGKDMACYKMDIDSLDLRSLCDLLYGGRYVTQPQRDKDPTTQRI